MLAYFDEDWATYSSLKLDSGDFSYKWLTARAKFGGLGAKNGDADVKQLRRLFDQYPLCDEECLQAWDEEDNMDDEGGDMEDETVHMEVDGEEAPNNSSTKMQVDSTALVLSANDSSASLKRSRSEKEKKPPPAAHEVLCVSEAELANWASVLSQSLDYSFLEVLQKSIKVGYHT